MLQPVGAMEAASHRLVVEPRVAPSTPHACPLCPANLCKVPAPACRTVAGTGAALLDVLLGAFSSVVRLVQLCRMLCAHNACNTHRLSLALPFEIL